MSSSDHRRRLGTDWNALCQSLSDWQEGRSATKPDEARMGAIWLGPDNERWRVRQAFVLDDATEVGSFVDDDVDRLGIVFVRRSDAGLFKAVAWGSSELGAWVFLSPPPRGTEQ